MKALYYSTLSFFSLLFLLGCASSPKMPMDELIDVGSHKLHIYCTGDGNPTVVIDTGITDTYEGWMPLIDQISQETRVCAYERAGYGQSEPGSLPRDSNRTAEELNSLLKNAGIKPKFILIGHLLGGLNMQVFADKYPSQVAGAILLDPPPLDWLTGTSFPELHQMFSQQVGVFNAMAEAARNSTNPEEKKQADFLEAVASEYAGLDGRSAQQADAIESFGDLPLVVIGSTQPNPNFGESPQDYQEFWLQQSEALAAKSTQGTFIRAEGSSHYIHMDTPQLVLDAIHQVVVQIRQGQ